MTTRRAFISVLAAVPALAVKQNVEITAGPDTRVIVFPGNTQGTVRMGVRTRIKADSVLVTVFFRGTVAGVAEPLLLSYESIAPVAGFDVYGTTYRDFQLTADRIEFIRLQFMDTVAMRETAKP